MQPMEAVQGAGMLPRMWVGRPGVPLLARFLGKFVLDIMPAALASVIGGFLFTQYQFGHTPAPRQATEQVVPASAEMLALVRDEHAMIIDYLKAQTAAEKSRLVALDAAGRSANAEPIDAQSDVKTVNPTETRPADLHTALDVSARRIAAAASPARPAASHAKPPAVATVTHAPLVIAQVDQTAAPQEAAAPSDRLARDPNSLLGKTLDLKDHVVATTRNVVFAIGDMFASVGERIGDMAPGGRRFSSDS